MTAPRTAAALLTVVCALAGCSAPGSSSDGPGTTTSAGGHGADAGTSASGAPVTSVAAGLERFGLTGKSVTEVVDTLDRTNADRGTGLGASVRMDQVVLSVGDEKTSLPMPADRTYVSIAPYVTQTHECFAHSTTSCQGENPDTDYTVTITDAAGKQLVTGTHRTYANGFVGFWLPRDITGTITVSGGGRTGSVPFSTAADAPTCITTLRLA